MDGNDDDDDEGSRKYVEADEVSGECWRECPKGGVSLLCFVLNQPSLTVWGGALHIHQNHITLPDRHPPISTPESCQHAAPAAAIDMNQATVFPYSGLTHTGTRAHNIFRSLFQCFLFPMPAPARATSESRSDPRSHYNLPARANSRQAFLNACREPLVPSVWHAGWNLQIMLIKHIELKI